MRHTPRVHEWVQERMNELVTIRTAIPDEIWAAAAKQKQSKVLKVPDGAHPRSPELARSGLQEVCAPVVTGRH
jgi:hypothetical protein